jgi:hypothetical protein
VCRGVKFDWQPQTPLLPLTAASSVAQCTPTASYHSPKFSICLAVSTSVVSGLRPATLSIDLVVHAIGKRPDVRPMQNDFRFPTEVSTYKQNKAILGSASDHFYNSDQLSSVAQMSNGFVLFNATQSMPVVRSRPVNHSCRAGNRCDHALSQMDYKAERPRYISFEQPWSMNTQYVVGFPMTWWTLLLCRSDGLQSQPSI